jgi:hypothetical protein
MPATLTEGTLHTVTWTASSSPSSPTYEAQFSPSGLFNGDETTAFKGATGTSYNWTPSTSLVAADTATCKLRLRARTADGNVSAWSTSAAFTMINYVAASGHPYYYEMLYR